MTSGKPRPFRHVAAAGALAALAVVWSFPLAANLTTHVPGGGAGDNVNFLWNFWWMREALGSPARFFFTDRLFAPHGADLTLHTHAALNAFAGATALRGVSPVAALNVTILASLFLNAFCAYLLAWRITRLTGPALFAAIVFGGSPYVAAHLNGHFNLTSAWTLPLAAMACFEMVRRDGPGRVARRPRAPRWAAAAAGALIGLTAYVDYYYVVYEIAFAVIVVAMNALVWSLWLRGPTAGSLRAARACAALALIDAAVIVAIPLTGGFDATVAGVRILAREVFNPLQALWLLVAAAALLRWRPALRLRPNGDLPLRDALTALAITAAVALAIAMPIVLHGLALIRRGDYVSQVYFWRNAPKGIDIATLLLGNPFHGVWGGMVRYSYQWLGIDIVEQGAWLGIAPMILAAVAIARRRASDAVRQWTAIGAVFFVWALGPHLMAFGTNTGMILPQTLLRYVPLAANARLPGRAMVVVYLAVAVLGAVALAEWQKRSRQPLAAAAVACLVLLDFVPAPFPIGLIDRPPIYDMVRASPDRGAVLELPVGVRDGFMARGFLDHRVLAYQMIHGRPIVGGFVARMAPSLLTAYADDPLIDALLTLSEPGRPPPASLPDRARAGERLAGNGIALVMLNREHAPAALVRYVQEVLPLDVVASAGSRTLYRVER